MVCAVLSSCNTDVEGTYYNGSDYNVSFETAAPSPVTTYNETATVDVRVIRSNTKGAYTATYTTEASADGIFTDDCNGTVYFADGQGVATISVTANNMDYDTYTYTMTLSDADVATVDTIVGTQVKTCVVTVTKDVEETWSDWYTWNSAGTCTYKYSQFFDGDDPGLSFKVRDDLNNSHRHQFAIEHWGYDVTLYLLYDDETGIVSVPSQYIGYTHDSYGDVYICDYEEYCEIRGRDFDNSYGSFDTELGIISIPVAYYVSAGAFGLGYEYIYLDGFPDLSSAAAYSGKFIDPSENPFIVTNITLGADVESAYVALVEGSLTEEIYQQIVAGTYTPMVSITESGEVRFDAAELADGNYTIVVVPFYGGTAQAGSSTTFKYTYNSAAETWTALYTGTYQYTAADYTSSQSGGIYEGSMEATLYKSDSDDTRYKITPWAGEESDGLIFTLNEDGTIVVDACETGDEYGSYGMVYASDLVTAGLSSSMQSSYADGVFSFYLAYYVSAGNLTFVLDTFTITGTASAKGLNSASDFTKNFSMGFIPGKKVIRRGISLK